MGEIMNVYFSSVIKMDRYKQIQPYLKESGISITVEPSKNSLFKILAQFIKQNRNTIFITNDWLKIPVCMLITHFLRGNPYILVLNGAFWKGWEEEGWSKARIYLYSFLANLVIRNCSYLVCNSNYIRLDVNKQFPSSRNKTRTIYNGIETQNSVSFQKFLYSSEKYNFLTINTFDYKEKYKGIIIILEALSRLFENTARLCILASINSNMGWDNFNNFKLLVAERFPNISIDFFTNVNVFEFFDPNNAIFVYSSNANSPDSLPRAILESQSAGMPSIIVDTTGCAEAVLPGRTALVVPPDPDALADAMNLLVNSPVLRRQMTEEAPGFIADHFSWNRMADGYAEIIKMIGGGRNEN